MTMMMRMERAKVSHSSLTHTAHIHFLMLIDFFIIKKIFFNNNKNAEIEWMQTTHFYRHRPIKHSTKREKNIRFRREDSSREWSVWKHDENKCKSIFIRDGMPMCLFQLWYILINKIIVIIEAYVCLSLYLNASSTARNCLLCENIVWKILIAVLWSLTGEFCEVKKYFLQRNKFIPNLSIFSWIFLKISIKSFVIF